MHTGSTLAEVSDQTTRYLADVAVTFPATHEMAQRVCDHATNRGLYASDFRVPDGMYSMAFDLGNSKEGSGRTASIEVNHSGFSVTRRFDSEAAYVHYKEPERPEGHPCEYQVPLSTISTQETFWYTRDVDSPVDPVRGPGYGDKIAELIPPPPQHGRGQWKRLGGEVLKNLLGDEDFIIDNVLRDVRAFLDGERGL